MPQYEVYEVETGRVVSTTDSLDEVANPLPEGLDVREHVAEETVEAEDAATETIPDSAPETAGATEPEAPAGEPAGGAGTDVDGQATPANPS
jgi:hypothetical protein